MVRYSTLDRTFSALSDPTRRQILERLASGPATISELAPPFSISLPGLMKHIRVLEDARLVVTEKRGRSRTCRLGSEQLDEAAQWIDVYRRLWKGRMDRLGAYIRQGERNGALSHDLRMERVYDAAPHVVFDAFTDPAAQKELYAHAPDWAVEAQCDLRVGGRWRISFGPPGGPAAVETNVFQVVDRPWRLVFSSTMKMPDGSSIDTDIQVTFAEENGGTRMTLVQRGFPAAEVRDDFNSGWGTIVDRLGRLVAARSGK